MLSESLKAELGLFNSVGRERRWKSIPGFKNNVISVMKKNYVVLSKSMQFIVRYGGRTSEGVKGNKKH